MKYPNDDDGDALRRTAERSDMTRPMNIDFMVHVPDETAGKEVARLASQRGYVTTVEVDDAEGEWTCYCTKELVPTYEAVVRRQAELDELSAPLGGHSDGWGTWGNE